MTQQSGVRAEAWQPAAGQLQAASGSVAAFASRLVAVSMLKHGNLLLASSKRCPPAWPKLVMASAHSKLRLPCSKRCPPAWPKLVMASTLAHGKLRLPSSKVRGCW
ncbi:hypothetical protein PR001_g26093 [Phytophthora rubi]|uniref:Uncharacterized protein n=1 Tax=Phytophthora rubi TaxID=129364 RepID=A0A6A3I1U2_9STRA|nr:hypothetical protein PR001_g26093 [Phytophthora rubi]